MSQQGVGEHGSGAKVLFYVLFIHCPYRLWYSIVNPLVSSHLIIECEHTVVSDHAHTHTHTHTHTHKFFSQIFYNRS